MTLPAPEEWAECLVEVPVTADRLGDVRLLRHGAELPVAVRRIGGQLVVVGEWPRSGSGHYALEATAGDESWQTIVTIEPRKITPRAFSRLLTELQSRLPSAVAIGLQRGGALTGVEILTPEESTIEAELLRLHRAALGARSRIGLIQGLPAIAEDPHSIFRTEEVWVGRQRARRLQPHGLVAALARPNNLDEERRLLRVPDIRVEHSVDVYENRLLRVYWQQVNARLRRVIAALERSTNREALEEARLLLSRLTRARRQAPFLDHVQMPAQLTANVTMVLLKRPTYRALFEGYLELHRAAAVRVEDPALDAPLDNLPRLYQLWATLHVIEIATQVATALGFIVTRQELIGRDANGLYIRILPDGRSVVTLRHPHTQTRVTVTPEKSYTPQSSPISSISYSQRPDVVIDIRAPDRDHRLLIFDPKYKLQSEFIARVSTELDEALEPADDEPDGSTGRPKKVDIDKMHAYRDAIQLDHRRVVDYAAILYPGPHVSYGTDVAALPAYPTRADELDEALQTVIRAHLAAAIHPSD
jgi:predicted component of viral defense system (DUF524 family)